MVTRLALCAVLVFCFVVFLTLTLPQPTSATSGLYGDFNAVYGDAVTKSFGCQVCHEADGMSLNPYGTDLADATGAGCADFNAPGSHSVMEVRGTCDARHAPGHSRPLASTCVGCHGKDLSGGNAPSCYACHGKLWSDGGGGSCPSFNPPADHTVRESEDGCVGWHKPGFESPFSSGCTDCHAANLRGQTGPSCYTCHGNEWEDDDAPPPGTPASFTHPAALSASDFATIENNDSDGDGFTNIEEIRAVSNPGDSSSTPEMSGSIALNIRSSWKQTWITSRKTLNFKLREQGAARVDTSEPVYLKSGKRTLMALLGKRSGNVVKYTVAKGLLYTLFTELEDAEATIEVQGMLENGDTFTAKEQVSLKGDKPELAENVRLKSSPKKIDPGNKLTLEIRGKNADEVDVEKGLVTLGMLSSISIDNAVLEGNRVTFTLSRKELKKLFGTMSDGSAFTLGVQGRMLDDDEILALSLSGTFGGGGGGGGGGDECFQFNPPSSHSVGLSTGSCTYMHAPGASTPLVSGCSGCHGSNLEGTSFAPSCTLCHGTRW